MAKKLVRNELSDEKLEQVSGGANFKDFVGMYDGIVGEEYYVSQYDNGIIWFKGELRKSWEKPYGNCGRTKRTHIFYITESCGFAISANKEIEVDGSTWHMYKTKK